MDKKKLGMIILCGAGVLLVVIVVVLMLSGGKGGRAAAKDAAVAEQNAYPVIPAGEGEKLPESKREMYKLNRGGDRIDDYWNSIAGEGDAKTDDPLADMTRSKGSGRSYSEVTDVKAAMDAMASAGESETSDRQQRELEYMRYKMERDEANRKHVNDMMGQMMAITQHQADETAKAGKDAGKEEPKEAEPVVEHRESVELPGVEVRRSGMVSSVEDEFSSIRSSGISSLDGTDDEFAVDESYPFKCMFVRQEKLKSGARVAVRLLEDMVINGQLIPANTHLMASCSISDRLDLTIASIEFNGRIIPFGYDAYDATDGVRGIFCPDIEEKKTSQAARMGGQMALTGARSYLGRLAGDALQVGSIFMSGSGKERTVTVPAGYQFYIVKSQNGRANAGRGRKDAKATIEDAMSGLSF